jgi:hypothetical protein
MKIIIGLIATALLSIAPGPLLGQPAPKRIAAGGSCQSGRVLPGGPTAHIRGIARCGNGEGSGRFARPRTSETVWSAQGCGPTSIKQIPERGLLDTVPSRPPGRARGCKLPRVAHLSVLELGKANNVAQRRFGRREGKYLPQLVGAVFVGCGASRARRIHRRGNRNPTGSGEPGSVIRTASWCKRADRASSFRKC